ncbi:hypothetical protein HXX76_006178 [Chlamydomonas incerta]|uniref:Fibronectin type III-like domain-containing protein n=1 Tax=Chlamydomonas incerta TaxID=51695 RepID=A0A835TD59_CHLIN|nr:hypothetical protein HXX76_006178 [Chlamydomonas incerta]|eukprot:KAG2436650.1 hypothetical protein HXX76_006178 [Chlamydomonas incerta]
MLSGARALPRRWPRRWTETLFNNLVASVVLLLALAALATESAPLTTAVGRGGASLGLRAGGLGAGRHPQHQHRHQQQHPHPHPQPKQEAEEAAGAAAGGDPAADDGMLSACSAAAEGLLGRMSLEDKASQLSNESPALEHVGLPPFNWWTECLHGFYTSGADGSPPATHFPMPLALAASFNTDLVQRVYGAIADEAKAHNEAQVAAGRPPSALNCFTPNINLLRDPRWGRASEVYGEDPHLTGRMAVAAVRGLQGDHPFAVKVGATCKHFAAHSLEVSGGVTRHTWDAVVDSRDLRESYLPAFRACVAEGRAHSVMCAYNKVNGVPACAHPYLLRTTLNDAWGFGADPANFVVSDCGAVSDIALTHHWNDSLPAAAAEALTAGGLSLFCDNAAAAAVPQAVRSGLLAAAVVEGAARRMLMARCRLGILGAAQPNATTNSTDYSSGADTDTAASGTAGGSSSGSSAGGTLTRDEDAVIRNDGGSGASAGASASGAGAAASEPPHHGRAHARLAYEAALRSITLLVNRPPPGAAPGSRPVLPLQLPPPGNTTRSGPAPPLLAVLGPHADGALYYLGTYYGTPSHPVVTPLAALREALGGEAVSHTPCLTGVGAEPSDGLHTCTAAAAAAAVAAVVFVGGSSRNFACGDQQCTTITPVSESEGLDRGSLRLPGMQEELVRAVARSGVPVVVVAVAGGPLDLSPLLRLEGVAAVLAAPYGGQQAGYALASVLLGTSSPSGRLPATWLYDWYTGLADPTSMAMRPWPGRTYRYLQVPVLFPFGFGLSYTRFATTDMRVSDCGTGPTGTTAATAAASAARGRQAAGPHGGGGGGDAELCFRVELDILNVGRRASGHSVLLLLRRAPSPPPPPPPGGRLAGGTSAAAAAAGGEEPGAEPAARGGCRPCAAAQQRQQPGRAQQQRRRDLAQGPGPGRGSAGSDGAGAGSGAGASGWGDDEAAEADVEAAGDEFAEWGGERYGHPDTLAAHATAYHRLMADRLAGGGGSGAGGGGAAEGPGQGEGAGGGDDDDDPPPLRQLVAFGRLEDVSPGESRTLVLEARVPAEDWQEQEQEEGGQEEAAGGKGGGGARRGSRHRYEAHLQAGALCCPLPRPAVSGV